MSNIPNKSFLPAIHRKAKMLFTPKNNLQEKRASDLVLVSKSRIFDKLIDLQPPTAKQEKVSLSKASTIEDIDRITPHMLSQSKKSSYINLQGAEKTGTTKKNETVFRQSRFESVVNPPKETKESPRYLNVNSNLSPEKRIAHSNGPQSFRSRSEAPKANKNQGVSSYTNHTNQTFDLSEVKMVDSIEMDEGEVAQCEIDIDNQVPPLKVPKKKKGYTALSEMVPLNLEEEKQKFFEKEFKYNPQFEYNNSQTFRQHFEKPHTKYLKIAKMILNACIRTFGDDERYMELTGGRLITKEETEAHFESYIKDLGLEGCLDILFSEKTVAPTSVIHEPTGKSRVVVSLPITYREHRILGVMHHEIGTHFMRKLNDRTQPWFKCRKKFELKPYLIIEEGLAALNQTLEHAVKLEHQPYLWNSALHYYSCYMSSVLGFEELFKDLEKYIKDPLKRWKECVRVKRGIADTSQPGGMYKDQVYMRGAIEILKNRKKIDFVLLYAGKINLKDLQKMIKAGTIKTDNLKLPTFLNNLDEYKAALDRIAEANFIDSLN